MKKKSLATLLSGFLTVALTGVGFASWIITGGDEQSTSGNVTAEKVENRKTSITISDTGNDTTVCFGHDATGVTEKWFKVEGTPAAADMKAEINFTVENGSYSTISFSVDETLQKYIDDKYITLSYDGFTQLTTNESTNCKVTLNFGWGQKYNFMNPYKYFNNIASPSPDDINNALDLNNLYNSLNSKTFTLTITATLKTA